MQTFTFVLNIENITYVYKNKLWKNVEKIYVLISMFLETPYNCQLEFERVRFIFYVSVEDKFTKWKTESHGLFTNRKTANQKMFLYLVKHNSHRENGAMCMCSVSWRLARASRFNLGLGDQI